MPSRLVNCTGADRHYAFSDPGSYKGLVMPPSNHSEWSDLIFALESHLVERYGIDEVSQWHFEVWNEMWGIEFPHPYLELYKASATALKAVSPRLRVGGPSTMLMLNVGDFVSAANAAQIPYDFVSTHLYATDPECVPGDASCFASMIASAREYVRTGAPWAEFLITEYKRGPLSQGGGGPGQRKHCRLHLSPARLCGGRGHVQLEDLHGHLRVPGFVVFLGFLVDFWEQLL